MKAKLMIYTHAIFHKKHSVQNDGLPLVINFCQLVCFHFLKLDFLEMSSAL